MKSTSFVDYFLHQMNTPGFASSIRGEYLVINQKLIETLLGYREADPGLLMRVLADFQYTHFRKMIPEKMLDLWIEGQVSGEFHLKLHSPGGGFQGGVILAASLILLMITHGLKNTQKRISDKAVIKKISGQNQAYDSDSSVYKHP